MATLLAWLCLAVLMHAGIAVDWQADMHQLSRQMMLQQLYIEERVRSEGRSGIKQVIQKFTSGNIKLLLSTMIPINPLSVAGERAVA